MEEEKIMVSENVVNVTYIINGCIVVRTNL